MFRCFSCNKFFCGIKALKDGTLVLNSIFSTAGLIIPCFLGIFFFEEKVTIIQIICIVVLLVSTFMLVNSSKKTFSNFTPKTLIWLIGSLISNGMVMFCQKLYGVSNPDGNFSLFSMFTFLIPLIMLLCLLPLAKKYDKMIESKKSETEKSDIKKGFPKILLFYSACLAVAVFIIQQFVTILTPKLSSAILLTFVNGSATVIATIVGAIMYNEKLNLKSCIAIFIAILSMICIKL